MAYVKWFPLARYARQAWSAPVEACHSSTTHGYFNHFCIGTLELFRQPVQLQVPGKVPGIEILLTDDGNPRSLARWSDLQGPLAWQWDSPPFLAWFYQPPEAPPEAPTRPIFEVLELCLALPLLRLRMWTAWVPSRPRCQAMHVSFPIFVPSLGESLNSPWHFHDNISVPP